MSMQEIKSNISFNFKLCDNDSVTIRDGGTNIDVCISHQSIADIISQFDQDMKCLLVNSLLNYEIRP